MGSNFLIIWKSFGPLFFSQRVIERQFFVSETLPPKRIHVAFMTTTAALPGFARDIRSVNWSRFIDVILSRSSLISCSSDKIRTASSMRSFCPAMSHSITISRDLSSSVMCSSSFARFFDIAIFVALRNLFTISSCILYSLLFAS